MEKEKKHLSDPEDLDGEDEGKDSKENSSTSSKSDKDVVTETDKEKNFRLLREKADRLEARNEELELEKSEREAADAAGRDLGNEDDDDDKDGKDDKNKNSEKSEAQKVAFDRDMKKAVKRWNVKNKVSPQVWAKIKAAVVLSGDELDDEIEAKIQAAYEAIPEVKAKREEDLINKGKKQAMKEFQDDELDIGTGGDNANGSSGGSTRLSSKEQKFAKAMGLTSDEMKNIDKDSDSYKDWQPLEDED